MGSTGRSSSGRGDLLDRGAISAEPGAGPDSTSHRVKPP